MKSFALVLLFSAAAFATPAAPTDFDFIAPIVSDRNNAPDQAGLILYDNNDDAFYGRSPSGVWQKLSPTGSTYLKADTSAEAATSCSSAYKRYSGDTNKVTLTPGSWLLNGSVEFNGTTGMSYTSTFVYWRGAYGQDNSSTPATLASVATVDAGQEITYASFSLGSNGYITLPASTVRVTVTSNTTIYLVPLVSCSNAANTMITTHIYAEKLN